MQRSLERIVLLQILVKSEAESILNEGDLQVKEYIWLNSYYLTVSRVVVVDDRCPALFLRPWWFEGEFP